MKPSRMAWWVGCVLLGLGLAWGWRNEWSFNRVTEAATDRSAPKSRPSLAGAPTDARAEKPPEFPADSIDSPHPVIQAVAEGTVLDTRIVRAADHRSWTRERLVQTRVQPRPVRVVEEWSRSSTGEWQRGRCDMYLADQLIVAAPLGISAAELEARLRSLGWSLGLPVNRNTYVVRLPQADLDSAPVALRELTRHPEIARAAEIDGVGFGGGVPNDSRFGEEWGFHNVGQSGGTVDADVNAPEFWDTIDSTPGVVVAVLDSGLNTTHPDLQGLAAVNTGEIPGDGIDNDGNGRVDDVNGWDFVNNDNMPADDHGHGSHVSGILAASRNDGQGVAGMLRGVKILPVKILNASNSGTTSNLIAATTYARLRGVPVMNLSLQNYPYSAQLDAEFNACRDAGIVLCICAGNQGVNNDTVPNYPSSYPHANIIAVGNHDRTDVRWSGASNPSNFGNASVDLFAPGRDVLSTVLGTDYALFTGTSMATPFVAAVAAALKFQHPTWAAPQIKQRILATVTVRPAYAGACVTGGRLNAAAAVTASSEPVPMLTSAATAAATTGAAFYYPAGFSGHPSSFAATGLPAGLAMNPATGVISGVPSASGTYVITLAATNESGTGTALLTLVVGPAGARPGRLVNLSVRTVAGTGDASLIVGVVVGGAGTSGTPALLVRGAGPTLAHYGVGGALADPLLDFYQPGNSVPLATNDNWGGDAQLATVGAAVGAFPFVDPASKDAALYFTPPVPVFSVVVRGAGGTTGIGLAEIYDTAGVGYGPTTPRLVNVSARAQVGTGDGVLIAGFVVEGTSARSVLIRAVGPTLGQYGVPGFLADPQLDLTQTVNGVTVPIASNDNWSGSTQLQDVSALVGAFAFVGPSSKDAAILVTLPPGVYSARASGVGNTTGVALVEVYEVP